MSLDNLSRASLLLCSRFVPFQTRIPQPKMGSNNDLVNSVHQKTCTNALSTSTVVPPPYRPRDPFSHCVTLRAQIELHQEVLLWQ